MSFCNPDIHAPMQTYAPANNGTTTTVTLPGHLFQTNDVIEIGNDDVVRTVTAVNGDTVTFSPAAATAVSAATLVQNWGAGETDLVLDLTLGLASPCIDAGSNSLPPLDPFDLDSDNNTTEPLPIDVVGNPRFTDDSATADTGAGTAPIVDMGAYER